MPKGYTTTQLQAEKLCGNRKVRTFVKLKFVQMFIKKKENNSRRHLGLCTLPYPSLGAGCPDLQMTLCILTRMGIEQSHHQPAESQKFTPFTERALTLLEMKIYFLFIWRQSASRYRCTSFHAKRTFDGGERFT